MKLTIPILLTLTAIISRAQTPVPPDCSITIPQLTAAGTYNFPNITNGFDNRTAQCQTFTVAYQSTGFGVTLIFQSSVGVTSPTSFGSYTGSTVVSTASFGTAANAVATFTNLTSGAVVDTPWLRIHIVLTGSGALSGAMYGYKTGYTGGTGGGGGGGGGSGCPNPCPVEGTANSGSVPVGPPVLAAGSDGTDVRTLKTDTSGNIQSLLVGSGTFNTGQVSVTGTAAALPTHASNSVCVKAAIANTINVYVGPTGVTTSTGLELPPGGGTCQPLNNSNLIFVIASTTGASVSWSITD